MARPHVLLDQDTTLIGGGEGQQVVIPQAFPIGMGGKVLPDTKQKSRFAKPERSGDKGKTQLLEYSADGDRDCYARLHRVPSETKCCAWQEVHLDFLSWNSMLRASDAAIFRSVVSSCHDSILLIIRCGRRKMPASLVSHELSHGILRCHGLLAGGCFGFHAISLL